MKRYKNYLMDMDGVLVRGRSVVPGAQHFIDTLKLRGINHLVLTNNPIYTPRDLSHRLHTMGLEVPEERIFTSAIATARFLRSQLPGGKAFVIGESGLTEAIHAAGYVITDHEPDYVVLGETHDYNLRQITKAIRLILAGARFVATNPDPSGPGEGGLEPACGAMAALIEKATGVQPFFVGKPNPLMIRTALNYLHAHSEETVMIGDRMDTDIVGAVSSGLDTMLVLSGVTQAEDIGKFPYQPTYVLNSIADMLIPDESETAKGEMAAAEDEAREDEAREDAAEGAAREDAAREEGWAAPERAGGKQAAQKQPRRPLEKVKS